MLVKRRTVSFMLLFSILLLGGFASAADQAIINSREWTDVYSGMLYSAINGLDANYIYEEGQGLLLLDNIGRDRKDVLLFESSSDPFIKNYNANLESRGYAVEYRAVRDDFNLELAGESGASGFIVMDRTYPYNAVSVAPYAVLKGHYVLFADSGNVDEVYDFLSGKPNSDIIIYGNVDREVSDIIGTLPVEIINEGDKFSNNLEIVKRYIDEAPVTQVLLTDGSFIEPQFFAGNYPVLFIGKTALPDRTIEYIRGSAINNAVLIGYDTFNNAVALKDRAGIKIMVKFAKGINQQQYALDMFSLPLPTYDIMISSVQFNLASGQLEVIFENRDEFPAMAKSAHNIISGGSVVASVGDDFAFFIAPGESKAVAYSADLAAYASSPMKAESNVLYGADVNELEYLSIYTTDIDVISVEDDSMIEIVGAVYNKPARRFIIDIKNTGKDAVYVRPEIQDIMVNEKKETLSGETVEILPGDMASIRIKASLVPADIEDNPKIRIVAWYGSRKTSLIHRQDAELGMNVSYLTAEGKIGVAAGAGLVILIIIILLLILLKRKRKKQVRHGHNHHVASGHAHGNAGSHHGSGIRAPPPPPRKG